MPHDELTTSVPPQKFTGMFKLATTLVAAFVLVCWPALATHASLRQDLTPGASVVIKIFEGQTPLTARVVQVSPAEIDSDQEDIAASLLSLRCQIDRVDAVSSSIWIFGKRTVVDKATRVPSSINSLNDLQRGQWIKIKVDTVGAGQWHAQRIEVNGIEKQTKINGVMERVWPDSLALAGLVIRLRENTRVEDHTRTPSERLFSDVVFPEDPREPAPWLNAGWFWSRGKIGVNQRIENDYSIGDSTGDRYRESEPHARMEFVARGPVGLSGFLKLRSRNCFVLENAPLRRRPRETAIHLYEGYVLWRDIAGLPLAAQVGRQDFDEYREWLFDAQLDAIRGYFYPLNPMVAEAAYINSLDDSPDNKYRTLRDYLIHLHGRPFPSTELGAYRLWRTDTDIRGREPIWTGLRWRGSYLGVHPWADIAWLRGWDKGRRFRASAYDIGATVSRPLWSRRVSFTIANARATGNDQNPKITGIDEEFRQTGYEDNTGLYDGVTSFQYYGEVFDPELANLDIFTLGGGIAFSPAASVDIVYHRYHQVEHSDAVLRDLESSDLTLHDYGGRGIDPDNGRPIRQLFFYRRVGWELDVIIGLVRVFGVVDVKWVTGYFMPQDALSPPFWEQLSFKPRKHSAFLNQISLEYRF